MGIHIPQASRQATTAAVLTLAGLVACDDRSVRPTRVGDAPVIVTNVEIVGPDNVPLGGTAQFSVIAHQSDGSTRDVTSGTSWRTGNDALLTIAPTGVATGRDRGETYITVSAVGRQATKLGVIIVPAGTYRLSGTVRDAGAPVVGAVVDVIAGTGQGLTATTSEPSESTPFPPGTYRLYGVAGDTEIRVARDGYQEQRRRTHVTGHQTLDVDLNLSRPREDLSGTYTLTITAHPDCVLPADVKTRSYTATLRQEGPQLTVTLQGSHFFVMNGITYNNFLGVVEPQRVTFQLSLFDYDYTFAPQVLERLPNNTYFGFGGNAVTIIRPPGLSGTLQGQLGTLTALASGAFESIDNCFSSGHRFVLSR